MRSELPVFRDRNMAACVAIAPHSCQPQLVPKYVRLPPRTSCRVRPVLRNCVPFGSTFATGGLGTNNLALGGTSGRHDEFAVDPGRHRNNGIASCSSVREQDRYGHCKRTEDAVMAIMKDTIQHCLNEECDVMRAKVLDEMAQGLVALCRVSVGVAAESGAARFPITIPYQFSGIKDEDLHQVRRMLQLTSLPFHNNYDEDLQALLKVLHLQLTLCLLYS